MRRELLVILFGLLLTVFLSACGGSTKNIGTMEPAEIEDGRSTAGVTLEGFEVIRCDELGAFNPDLNDTLDLRLEESNGKTELVISVNDADLVSNIALEVRWDAEAVHVDSAEFNGIYGANDAIEGKFLGVAGKAGIAQVCIGSAPAELSGDFATVTFVDGPSRTVSAANGVHGGDLSEILYPENEALPCFAPTSDPDNSNAMITWYGAYHKADGNQDSLITVADITPIGVYYNQSVATNWLAALADYKPDRLVEVGDITPIGVNYDTGTDGWRLEVSDDTVADYTPASNTLIAEVTWTDEEYYNPQSTADTITPGQLWPVFAQWEFPITTATDFTWDDLGAPDTNGNHFVRVWIVPFDDDKDGIPASGDVEIYTEPVVVQDVLVIQNAEVRVTGTDNGSADDVYNENTNTGTVAANAEDVDMSLHSLSGTFNAVVFDGSDPGNWPEGLTQAIYDQAFGLAAGAMTWDINHDDVAIGCRRTGDWLVLDSGTWGSAGDPGTADVFPDYDPDTVDPAFEGGLDTFLGNATFYDEADVLKIVSYQDIELNLKFDVLKDEVAAELAYYEPAELNLNEATTLQMPFKWGSNGAPVDVSTTALELHEINTATGNSLGVIEDLEYTVEENPEPGFFTIFEFEESTWITANVPGGNVGPSSSYAFRFQADGIWSTINLPADMLTTAEPPPAQELMVLPDHLYQDIDEIQFFYEEPMIRRLPSVYLDTDLGSLVPNDVEGYNDILKTTGDEFIIGVSGGIWPKVAIVETGDPNTINSLSDGMSGIISYLPSPGRLRCDVSVITTAGDPGDPDEEYSFKWFNSDASVVGQGTFTYTPTGTYQVQPVGRYWGVNVFDREEGDLADRDYTGKNIVDGSSVAGANPTPDVLWFEFGGGWMYESEQNAEGIYSSASAADDVNVLVHLVNSVTDEDFYMGLGVRAAGLTTSGDIIAIHSLTQLAWTYSGIPAWPGKLESGQSYDVWLDDPAFAGGDGEYHYSTPLVVTGPNPNDL